MNKTKGGAFSGAIALVCFLALAAYLAAGLGSKLKSDLRWETVSARSVESFFYADGIIIREELSPLEGQAPEGRRLGAGDGMGEGFFAPASGIYFSESDSLSYLSPEDIPKLDASTLSQLLSQEIRQEAQGRLIRGNCWYFICLPPSSPALEVGSTVMLDLGLGEIPCLVQETENSVAVFRMETQLVPHASLRKVRGKIISESFSGLALPTSALRQSGEEHYVWVIAAGRLEKKIINVIFFGEDFVLAEKTDKPDALQEGDKLVTAGEDLYEGKIII